VHPATASKQIVIAQRCSLPMRVQRVYGLFFLKKIAAFSDVVMMVLACLIIYRNHHGS